MWERLSSDTVRPQSQREASPLNLRHSFGRSVDWKYTNLVLVGHSEGAVVIRRMVLNRFDDLCREGKKEGLKDSGGRNNFGLAQCVQWIH